MAATKLLFINQPISTVAGYTLQGSGSTNLTANAGIQVGVYDASNVLQTADTSSVTISLSAGTGTLGGTLVQSVKNGYATFNDLSISTTAGGTNYTLGAADSALTAATSNVFSQTLPYRVNPQQVSGSLTAQGQYVGPYRFRGNRHDLEQNTQRVSITGTFTGTIQLIVVNPGADQTAAANQTVLATYTSPTSQVIEFGGRADFYFYSSVWSSGTANVALYY